MTLLWKNKKRLQGDEHAWIKASIQTVLRKEGLKQPGELSISLVTDDEMKRLNFEHRGVNCTTDVLSFPQFESLEEAQRSPYLLLGDMVLNITQMKRQAEEFGHSQEREISYLSVHSLYHLLGFDHEDESSKRQMRAREEEALREMGIFE